jgi:transcriptional regulator with XRE-family HTH domain
MTLYARFDLATAQWFGTEARVARIRRDETQTETGKRTGITRARLSKIETGRCAVRLAEREALVRAFPELAAIVNRSVARGVPAGPHAPRPPAVSDPNEAA